MATTIKTMNKALYNASYHLLEAGKHLTNVQDFRPEAVRLFKLAELYVNIIQPEPEKITEQKMLSILDEILNTEESK